MKGTFLYTQVIATQPSIKKYKKEARNNIKAHII